MEIQAVVEVYYNGTKRSIDVVISESDIKLLAEDKVRGAFDCDSCQTTKLMICQRID